MTSIASRAQDWRGLLLAAGKGSRFDPAGNQNKLLQITANGQLVAENSARNLLAVLPDSLAILCATSSINTLELLSSTLQKTGCMLTVCANAEQGMAASLVHGLQQSADYAGWIIALADMPYVKPDSIKKLLQAMQAGVDMGILVYQGQRGNPVGFSRKYLDQLLALSGDQGARKLLQQHLVTEIAVDDPGILRDIDVPEDLAKPI
ncbi:nucleotidyltransferase family protein [Undibacterium sp. RTI2.1]|uniref:nucleotidyltransferase family protein n=1 Tax=unclassified Undibacterium TaxID=2630295 RepID=UPI002AB57A18|nr:MULTISPECIES: nucleotidyltransferase family protein [unclassified Undibacterium]MDY7539153.1 nucleotidyltransferase family protein [Undibacterium sp. 5I1]MEB0031028.1 nucleotidyltransferase family protein [Undibacterium sp. RTI2.1]MEB0116285.1 nucleotidyltransferase family protein [Undibacterium sp. RTI2.2]MEB0232419.1 nucleotidyltransferase family protein [Undibacterium sp. 10I3]MEB0257048.1 nucleotidyltransferase family protein [Undibacterium sp. 5I1]